MTDAQGSCPDLLIALVWARQARALTGVFLSCTSYWKQQPDWRTEVCSAPQSALSLSVRYRITEQGIWQSFLSAFAGLPSTYLLIEGERLFLPRCNPLLFLDCSFTCSLQHLGP